MNNKLDFIFQRRSIRKYAGGQISEELIHDLLEAGMAAPSAVQKDPWSFIVVRKQANLNSIANLLPSGTMLADSELGLVVCGDLEKAHDGQLSYLLQDCSAAIENILLAANALGIGACWLGVHPRQERLKGLREILDIPQDILPLAVISMGSPGEEKPPRTRYSADRVHWERW